MQDKKDKMIRQKSQFNTICNKHSTLINQKQISASKSVLGKRIFELKFNIRAKKNEQNNTLNTTKTKSNQLLIRKRCSSRNKMLKSKRLTGIIKCVRFNTDKILERPHTSHYARNHKRMPGFTTSKTREKLRSFTVQEVRTIINGSKVEFFIPNCRTHTRNNSMNID
jgi:hypothetical protein